MTMDIGILIKCEIQSATVGNMVDDKEIKLTIKGSDNAKYLFTAHETSGFHLTGMRLRNIIDHIVIFGGRKSEDRECNEKLFFLHHGRLPKNDPEKYWRRVNEESEEVKRQEKILIEIMPFCGAYVLILARRFSLRIT